MVWDGNALHGKPDRHEKDHTPEDVLELSVCTVYRDHCVCSVDLAVRADLFPAGVVCDGRQPDRF